MQEWVNANSALWALLALPVMVVAAVPTFAQLRLTARDRSRSVEEIRSALMATGGRITGSRRRASLSGAGGELLPISFRTDHGRLAAIEYAYDRVQRGDCLLIVGGAGSGKSQMLASLHRISYERASGHEAPLIEIVELVELYGKSRILRILKREPDVLTGAINVIADRYQLSRQATRRLILESQLIIALDGLDELPKEHRRGVASQIADYSLQRPVLLTSRPFAARENAAAATDDPLGVFSGTPIVRVDMELLDWEDVSAELTRLGIPIPTGKGIGRSSQSQLRVPLQFQVLSFLWRRGTLTESQARQLLARPERLVAHLVSSRPATGRDRALRLAGVLLADHNNETDGTFRVFPIHLAGWALWLAKFLFAIPAMIIGIRLELWVTAPALVLGLLMSTPYPNSIWTNRALTLWTGNIRSRGLDFLTLALAFGLVHLVRVVSWSIQVRRPFLGNWSDLYERDLLALIIWVWALSYVPPYDSDSNVLAWGRMRRRSWPQYALFALASAALTWGREFVAPRSLFFAWLYLGSSCAYSIIGVLVAWRITGTSPWRWGELLGELVARGILTRNADKLRFGHASFRVHVARALARDPDTPKLLWRVFGAHWTEYLIEQDMAHIAMDPDPVFDRSVVGLARSHSWSPICTYYSICYLQWCSIQPMLARDLLRRHLRKLPRSWLGTLTSDVLDRVGDPRGLSIARSQLNKGIDIGFALHWPLRVVERHDDYDSLVGLVDRLEMRLPDPELWSVMLSNRRLRYQMGMSRADLCESGSPLAKAASPLELAALALEQTPPRWDVAQRLLVKAGDSALKNARLAQALFVRGDVSRARDTALYAGTQMTVDVGYDEIIEVMLTLALVEAEGGAADWLERAVGARLQLRGRPGLRRNLRVTKGGAPDAILAP